MRISSSERHNELKSAAFFLSALMIASAFLVFTPIQFGPSAYAVHVNPAVVATIPVGSFPTDVAVNPATGRIYAVNFGSSTISVIDGATNSVVATIPVTSAPWRLAVNPATNRIYVAHLENCGPIGPVTVINGDTNEVEAVIAATCRPYGIAVNPLTNLVYVANFATTVVIDGASNTIVNSINCCSNENSAAVNTATNRIYVGSNNVFSPLVKVINGGTNSVEGDINVSSMPWRIAVNPDTNRIYVTTQVCQGVAVCEDKKLVVINGGTNVIETKIPIGADSSAVAVNPSTNKVYVAGSNGLLTIDGATNTVENTLAIGQLNGVAINPTTDVLYVTKATGTVTVIASDTDDDGITDQEDNCPAVSNPDQTDFDGDGIGDECDPDNDNDGVDNLLDNCPIDANPSQTDTNSDGRGDVCTADANGPYSGSEGIGITLDATGSYDIDSPIIAYEWDLDNDGDYDDATGVSPSAVFHDNGIFPIGLKITDGSGLIDTDTSIVTVSNVAPTLDSIIGPIDPVGVGTQIVITAPFTDLGTDDLHAVAINWGDGTTSGGGGLIDYDGSAIVSIVHNYASAGVYTVEVIVTDDDGESDTELFQYVVVYDPTAGFVTGGGWIDSPPGAYGPDASLTGKAIFGFTSKYEKGATTPSGKTSFKFNVANLDFSSDIYEWLVVAGAKAQFKGTGTINSDGEYGFMLTAIDGQINGGGGVDKFRIKIWDKATDTIIYDNQLGAAEDASPTTVIGGGGITIHK
jgi:YVTN family beta-propeller protein